MKKRERTEVVADILLVVQQAGGSIKPTHLLYKANLSHDALKRYVDELEKGGMLTTGEKNGKRAYHLTDKGYDFLAKYRQFRDFSDAFGI
jgi:predicted transcriptional regulator